MARGRLISRSLGSSRKFHAALQAGGKLGEFCQVLFPLIVANTDDFGRMPGDAFTVKNLVLPSSRRPERDFDKALDVLADVMLIDRYHVDGVIYLQVNQFDTHQPNLHKRTESRFPGDSGISQKYRSNLRELNLTESKRTENSAPRVERRAAGTLFDLFWAAYPKKKAKEEARKAWNKRRPDNLLLDAMLIALAEQIESADWQKEKGRYIPHPATWINGARWTDSVDIPIVDEEIDRTCRHLPMCKNPGNWECLQKTDIERMKAS